MRTIKARLMAALTLLCVMTIAIAGIGYYAANVANKGLETVYSDRVVPLRDLKAVADYYAVNIVDASHKVRNGNFSWQQGREAVAEAMKELKRHWNAYSGTYMVPEEKRLADQAGQRMGEADAATTELNEILRREDKAALDSFVINKLYAAIDPVSDDIGKLVELQTRVAQQQYEISHAAFGTAITVMIVLLVLTAGSVFFAIWTTLFGVVKPLGELNHGMKQLAEGDFEFRLTALDRRDEIGAIAQSVERFKVLSAEKTRADAEAQHEAETRAAAQRKADTMALADSFERAVGGIVNIVAAASTQLDSTAEHLTQTATATTDRCVTVAAASEEASSNVNSVASAAEELSASIREIAQQVHQSNAAAAKASSEAEQTTQQVRALAEAGSRIGNVVALITDIAAQTNLLALNATIEAARAGEAGPGFAVVASEVKALADQTAKATAEISSQITGIQGSTQQATEFIEGIASTIQDVNSISGSIASAMEEQGAATQEIAHNVHQASQGTSEVAKNITEVQHSAEGSSAAAGQVLTAARDLSKQAEALRGEVESFLNQVRAA